MLAMQALGDVALVMASPFNWRVRHAGVFIDSGDDWHAPEGACTNPYGAADDHWRQLTAAERVISLARCAALRWQDGAWLTIEAT